MSNFWIVLRSFLLKITLLGVAVLLFAGFYMDAWLVEKMNGKKWTVPAVVYARPLDVYEGLPMALSAVASELRASGYREMRSGKPGTFDSEANALNIRLRAFKFSNENQPAQTVRISFNGESVASVRSSLSKVISDIRLPPMEIGRIQTDSQEDRQLVNLREVPQLLIDALIITEDRYFYSHHGVSFRGIARAFIVNTKEGHVVEGASTLTQQLIKNFFLDASRSYSRKLLEISLAMLLELHVEKNDILEAYLNEVFVLQDGAKAIHGFGLASQYLFGLPVSSLSVEQSALLVAMLKGPSYYNPLRHPKQALERRNLVLSLLVKEGKLTEEEGKLAISKPLGLIDRNQMLASYPAYLDLIRRQLRRDYSEDALKLDGLRIFSNLDPQWQWRAQKELQQGTQLLAQKYGAKGQGIDGAVVVSDNATGDVLAVVGGKSSTMDGFNRALDAKRAIGSLVKPAIYLTAFKAGYTLERRIADEAISIKTAKGAWRPQNYDRKFHGDVPLYYAMAKSYNGAAVNVGMSVGVNQVIKTLHSLGVEDNLPALPSLLLGAVELSPLNVAQAYGTIANKGFYTPLKTIQAITDAKGQVIMRYPLRIEQRFAPDVMYLLHYAMQAVIQEGTGASVKSMFKDGVKAAGKTGTTNDQRDSWFAGFDGNKQVVVWLGRDDNAPLPVTGGSGALPIWAKIIASNPNVSGNSHLPDNVHSIWIDRETGKLSAEGCSGAMVVPFIEGTEPTEQVACANFINIKNNWFQKWFQ